MNGEDFINIFEADEELVNGSDVKIKKVIPLIEANQEIDGTPVLFIIADGESTLEYLIKNHPLLLEKKDINGWTLLHAATAGFSDICFDKILNFFKNSKQLNIKDNDGFSPLSIAAKFGNTDKLQKLIVHGATTSTTPLETSPLYQAIININGEDVAIYCLQILSNDIKKISPEEKQSLIEASQKLKMAKLENWIKGTL
ncbi:hypothetical protein ABGV49_03100 [Chromobacterium vaccinii]|uniref:Ankyrin repeat domain-containing protein n=1 Tax=Chromobacterium vaccinii TaxID=1108595 RepID=A0ABV0F7M5_9NEIS